MENVLGFVALAAGLIIGLGAIISAGETAVGENPSGIDWGVLQAIGMAGLATLLVIRLPSIYRWLIGAGILVVYQIILDHFLLDFTLRSPHGGLYGSLDWSAMMILGTALADLFHSQGRAKKVFPWASAAILVAGIALAFYAPVSKHRVSSSYVLITLGISALLFLVFQFVSERYNWQGRFLVVWGKNPLILYFLHYLLIGIFFLPGIPALYTAAPLWLAILEIVFLLIIISWVAFWMDRKNIIIAL